MKSSFELLWDWERKKMNLDEQIFKRVDKTILIQLVNQNVSPDYLDLKIIKTPVVKHFGGFFMLWIEDVRSDVRRCTKFNNVR